MYQLFIGNKNYSSWSLRPWILMTTLQIPFQEQLVPFSEGMNWVNYRKFCPSGKVPCLVDDELHVWDSMAITEYLAETHDDIWPTELKARTWARCAAAEMHSGFDAIRNICGMNVGLEIRLHDIPEPLSRDLARLNELWCEGIERFGGPFLAGDNFTAVDAFFAPVGFRVKTFDLDLKDKANAYCRHLLSLKGMTDWQESALDEPWRDPSHEEEMAQFGEILADHRRARPN